MAQTATIELSEEDIRILQNAVCGTSYLVYQRNKEKYDDLLARLREKMHSLIHQRVLEEIRRPLDAK